MDNLPNSPVILAVNHHSYMDPPLVLLSFPRWKNLTFAAHMDLWKVPLLGWILTFYEAIPVAKGVPTKSNIQRLIELLKQGKDICIFPEGGIIEKPGFSPAYRGISLIAEATEGTVVPVCLKGTLKWIKRPWQNISITYKKPIRWKEFAEQYKDLPKKELHILFAKTVLERIYEEG